MLEFFCKIAGSLERILTDNQVLVSLALCLIAMFFAALYIGTRRKLKNAEYFLDVVRTVSKALAKNHEIAAFNETGEVIYTTHPQLYTDKEEFRQSLMERMNASSNLKKLCEAFDATKPHNTVIEGDGSGLSGQFKRWLATLDILAKEETLIGDGVTVVTLSDISHQYKSEAKAVTHCERLEAFLDNFPLGIFYATSKGEILGANATFAKIVNISREKLIGLNIKDFIDSFAHDVPTQVLLNVSIKPRFCQEVPAILIKFSSSTASSMQPWIIYKSRTSDTASNVPKEPSAAEFMSQEVFTSASLPSIVATSRGEVIALNPAFATMVQDQVILEKHKIMQPGANVLDFIQAQGKNSFVSYLSAAQSSAKASSPVEVKVTNSEISAMAHISCIRHSGSSTKLVLIQLVDISSQKMLEQRLIQSQKLQAIGQLAGGIAHDFNNLLTAMIGFCDLLLQRYTINDSSYGDVVQIKQNAGRAANLVRQLLAFSRQQTLKPSVISITEVLLNVSSLLKRLVGANIDLRVMHGKELWLIKADIGQLEQVIINLVVNARDAMPNGGQLVITTRNCFVEKEFKCVYDTIYPGDYLTIEVADTGCGIEPSVIGNIFDPFFSRKDDKTHKSSGTGLGLSTVYGIINQTGGFIHVDSEVGKGSIFRIYLPKYAQAETEKVATPNAEEDARDLSGTGTILLVDDEESVRIFSARALRDKGYKVLEATCGEEALKIAEEEKFDLLVTDVVMPKMDGPTLSKILKDKFKKLDTIFTSGYAESTFRQDVDQNLDIHFLQKPFTLKDLARKVKEVLMHR